MPDREQLDEIWAAGYQWDGTVLTRGIWQPSRRPILETIASWRSQGRVARDGEALGRWCLAIPHEDYEALGRSPKWREIKSSDPETRQRAWRRFLQSPDSAPYRVRERAS